MKMKKFISLSIAMCLMLSGCGKEDEKEYGSINEVTINEEVSEVYPEKNIFIESAEDLGYEYKIVNSDRAMMQFKIPKNWTVKDSTQRHFEFVAPADDPLLPGVTLHIMHSFRQLSSYGDQGVESFEEFFARERLLVFYSAGERSDYYQTDLGHPEYLVTDESITKDNSSFTMHVYESADLFGRVMGRAPEEEYSAVYAYVKWENTPHCISIACPADYLESAKALLNYIISSIKYLPPQPGSMKVETYEGISLTLPADFERYEKDDYVVFEPSFESGSCHSGSAVGIYDLEYDTFDAEAIWNFCQPGGPGEKICESMYGPTQQYMLGICGPAETTTLDGVSVEVISPTVDINSSPDVYSPLEVVSNNYLAVYAMPKEDGGMRAIVYMGTSSPLQSGQILINSILTKTQIS